MAHPRQGHDERGQFTPIGKERLSANVRGVRLPLDVDEFLEQMSSSERSEWLRQVISAAARDQQGVDSQDASK